MQCNAMQCNAMQCSAVQYNTKQETCIASESSGNLDPVAFQIPFDRHATILLMKSVFFHWKSVSIRILHLCIDVSRKRSRDSYHDAVCKKIATLCNRNRQPAAKNQHLSFTSRGATVGLGLHLWLTRSIVLHRRRNLPFFSNLAEKASCVDDKTVLFRYTYP